MVGSTQRCCGICRISWLKAPLERDHCWKWLVKWSAALARLLSRNRQARLQMRFLWYPLFYTSGYQNFSASLVTTVFRALWLVKFFSGHKSSSGEFFFMFFMIVFMAFSCTNCLKPACRWQWGKTDRFPTFRLVAFPDTVWTTWLDTFPHSQWQTFWGWLVWFSP